MNNVIHRKPNNNNNPCGLRYTKLPAIEHHNGQLSKYNNPNAQDRQDRLYNIKSRYKQNNENEDHCKYYAIGCLSEELSFGWHYCPYYFCCLVEVFHAWWSF